MIYLVRHGQTAFNAEGRFQGQSDSPLTALGEAQARQVGAALGRVVGPDIALVASPLGRTQHTARIIAEAIGHRGPFALDPRLAEVTMGSWDGMTGEDIDTVYPGARDGLPRMEWWFHSPDGETYPAFSSRLAAWLAEAEAGPKPLIAVSHGGVSRVLRGFYLNLPKEEALWLDVPQDAIFRFHKGQVEQIDCPPL
jgi:broad specificity phosphatase PhoE